MTIDKNGMNVVRTGLKVRVPNGMYGMIHSIYEISLKSVGKDKVNIRSIEHFLICTGF